jgi:ABC-type transporter Mla subunit MlaD
MSILPMKALTWRSVSGGIAGFVAMLLIVFVVLRYARTGQLRGDKFRLFVAVPDATDLLKGSEVWLNGQRVGTVTSIDFAPASKSPDERVIISADVLERFRANIRLDSRATLQSGGTIIGAPVVYLTSGTLQRRAVAAGDTIRGAGKSDFEIAASRTTEALEELPAIAADARTIMADAQAASRRVGAIARAGGWSSVSTRSGQLMRKLSGSSPPARLARDTAFRSGLARTMAAGDSLRRLLASRRNEIGRFRRDTSLGRAVQDLRADVATLRTLATSPNGTVGRIAADSALVHGLDSMFVELTALMADIKKNPLRYARVF